MNNLVFDLHAPKRLLLHPVDKGYEINGSLSFVTNCSGRQLRYIFNDRHFISKGCHKKAMAKAVKEKIRQAHSGNGHVAQEAYVCALRVQGLKPSLLDLFYLQWRRLLG